MREQRIGGSGGEREGADGMWERGFSTLGTAGWRIVTKLS